MSAPTHTAFVEGRLLCAGTLAEVAARAAGLRHDELLIFEDATGRRAEIDPRGDLPTPVVPPPARGRPKLGVVAREVTLLPRHWDWLATQPGGASAALRRLVEDARRNLAGADRARQAQQALYSVMSVLGGDLPGFEAATRALYAGDDPGFDAVVQEWPTDAGDYLFRLAAAERAARVAAA